MAIISEEFAKKRRHGKLLFLIACAFILISITGLLAIKFITPAWFLLTALGFLFFMVGVLAYFVRQTYSAVYSVLEMIAGCLTCVYALFELASQPNPTGLLTMETAGTALKLAAGVYIIVRGLHNMDQTWKKPGKIRNLLDLTVN